LLPVGGLEVVPPRLSGSKEADERKADEEKTLFKKRN
jgi:hypothetical protein